MTILATEAEAEGLEALTRLAGELRAQVAAEDPDGNAEARDRRVDKLVDELRAELAG